LSQNVTYLSAEEAKRAMEVALFNPLPLERMWGYWVARVKRSMPDVELGVSFFAAYEGPLREPTKVGGKVRVRRPARSLP
jgi:hypothetical protein